MKIALRSITLLILLGSAVGRASAAVPVFAGPNVFEMHEVIQHAEKPR